jgi:hypothetical protein
MLACGDCLEMLEGWCRDRGFHCDLVFTSPPYVDARTYGIGFALKDDAWVQWCADRFMACLKVTDGLVAFVVQGRTRRYEWDATPAKLMAELANRGAVLRNPPIFHRVGVPGSGGSDWLRSDYEWIVCATRERGKLPWSSNTAMGSPCKFSTGGVGSYRDRNGARMRGNYKPPKLANPGNVITCSVGGGRMGSWLAHENEAPFPERLAEFFVRSFCPPGGLVLDPFCGSGTTCAVAVKTGRLFAGIDIRQSQIDLTSRRLIEAAEFVKRQGRVTIAEAEGGSLVPK